MGAEHPHRRYFGGIRRPLARRTRNAGDRSCPSRRGGGTRSAPRGSVRLRGSRPRCARPQGRGLAVPSSARGGRISCLGLVAVLGALSVTFLVNGSLTVTVALIAAVSVAALVVAGFRRPSAAMRVERRDVFLLGAVVLVGCVLAGVAWVTADIVAGDALFHLGRVRKLVEAPALTTLGVVNEFRDGSLHPGYALPLWHAVLALVAQLAAVDSTAVVLHLDAALVPLLLIVVLAAGWAVFRSRTGGAVLVVAFLALVAFPRAGVGAFELLALPATAGRLLLGSAIVALAFSYVASGRRSRLLTLGAAALALAVVHVTLCRLRGPATGRLRPGSTRPGTRGTNGRPPDVRRIGAVLVPAAIVCAALVPLVRSTRSCRRIRSSRARALALRREPRLLGGWYSLAPQALTRGGAAFVAAFVAIGAAALARRSRWAAFVVGGIAGRPGRGARAAVLHRNRRARIAVAGAAPGALPAACLRARRRVRRAGPLGRSPVIAAAAGLGIGLWQPTRRRPLQTEARRGRCGSGSQPP